MDFIDRAIIGLMCGVAIGSAASVIQEWVKTGPHADPRIGQMLLAVCLALVVAKKRNRRER